MTEVDKAVVARARLAIPFVVLFVGCSRFVADNLDPLPPWGYREVASCVRREVDLKAREVVTIRLLAWRTIQDDRPLRVDLALVWARIQGGGSQKWATLLIYRHPSTGKEWWGNHITDVSWKPVAFFDHPPTNVEIYRFIDSEPVPEKFFDPPRPEFFILASGLRTKTWKDTIGEAPVRQFRPSSVVDEQPAA